MTRTPPFTPIYIDRGGLTIMGVAFPDLETLNGVARALGSGMYDGLEPTPLDVEAIRDHCTGRTTFEEMVAAARDQYGTKEWPRKKDRAQESGRMESEYTEAIRDHCAGKTTFEEMAAALLGQYQTKMWPQMMDPAQKSDLSGSEYADADTGVFYNLLDEASQETLQAIEYRAAARAAYDLRLRRHGVKEMSDILWVHRCLFGRVYPWAGQVRAEDEPGEDSGLIPLSHWGLFFPLFFYMDYHLSMLAAADGNDKEKVARLLASMLINLNVIHPFREGNGRTQRLVMELLAAMKGHDLDLSPPDDPRVHEAYTRVTGERDEKLLTKLILGRMTPGADPEIYCAPEKMRVPRKNGGAKKVPHEIKKERPARKPKPVPPVPLGAPKTILRRLGGPTGA